MVFRTPAPTLALPFGLLHCSPFSAHLQSKIDDSEQAFAGWTGEVPPSKGVPELRHYATEPGRLALGGKRVGPGRGPESQGVGQGQRQRDQQEPQAGGPPGPV